MMHDAMESIHPITVFVFFAFALIMPMLFLHPVFICISFITGTIWSFYMNGKNLVAFLLKTVLPLTLIVSVLNPLFNHQGVTVLFYLRDNPITIESICYGITSALMFGTVLIWFSCFNRIVTSDKIIYLFGNLLPSISILITMVLRFVPLYRQQIKKFSIAMRAQGFDYSEGNLLDRAKHGLSILSALITWGLESSVATADSMRSRGHGLVRRTTYSRYRFDKRDILISVILAIGIGFVGIAASFKAVYFSFYPFIKQNQWDVLAIACVIVYSIILLLPIILNLGELAAWHRLKLKN